MVAKITKTGAIDAMAQDGDPLPHRLRSRASGHDALNGKPVPKRIDPERPRHHRRGSAQNPDVKAPYSPDLRAKVSQIAASLLEQAVRGNRQLPITRALVDRKLTRHGRARGPRLENRVAL